MDLAEVAIIHEWDNNFSFFLTFFVCFTTDISFNSHLKKLRKKIVFSSVSYACKIVHSEMKPIQISLSIHKMIPANVIKLVFTDELLFSNFFLYFVCQNDFKLSMGLAIYQVDLNITVSK